MPRKLTVTARTIFSPPLKAQMVSEGESQGRHLDTAGVDLLANTIDGPERTDNSLASWTDKDVCQRPCAITFGPHRRCPLRKKVWSPTCPLNGSFQSPNCPLNGFFFTRQTGLFSRKWPDGGRFFEPCFLIELPFLLALARYRCDVSTRATFHFSRGSGGPLAKSRLGARAGATSVDNKGAQSKRSMAWPRSDGCNSWSSLFDAVVVTNSEALTPAVRKLI